LNDEKNSGRSPVFFLLSGRHYHRIDGTDSGNLNLENVTGRFDRIWLRPVDPANQRSDETIGRLDKKFTKKKRNGRL